MSKYIEVENSISFQGGQPPMMLINLEEFAHSYADYWIEGAWDESSDSARKEVVDEIKNRLESFIGGCTDKLDGKFMFLWPLLKKPVQDILLILYNDVMLYPDRNKEEFKDLPYKYQEEIRAKPVRILKAMEDRETFYQVVIDTLDTFLYCGVPVEFDRGVLRVCVRHVLGIEEYPFDFLDGK